LSGAVARDIKEMKATTKCPIPSLILVSFQQYERSGKVLHQQNITRYRTVFETRLTLTTTFRFADVGFDAYFPSKLDGILPAEISDKSIEINT
jgi:hypothetical protein